MKKYITILYVVLLASCAKESPIEGLMATNPAVATVHAEIPSGSNKTIAVTVNGETLNLDVTNTNTTANGIETRHCTVTMQTNTGIFPIGANSAYLRTMSAGTEISASVFEHPSYSGTLFWATRGVNTNTYSYLNTNGIHFGDSYYVPLKIKPTGNPDAPIYAYVQFTVVAEKVVLDKVVYRVMGSLSVGE
ncbi:MAG: hypothetical protein J7623_22685 [Chitinophaga sp.]|uniref:hypothetical protein n=1 Tax=Chitinophaga sp. TaxID=1869181 RepID=UPI001B101E2D|nr:hypothetical protein [Chitinophaga sp.]MBO9731465.1 hypothetical protein [Chitinophaga sp.]